MTVVADYVAPAPIEVASQEAVDALISNIKYSAKTEQDLLEMFQLATEVYYTAGTLFDLRLKTARRLAHTSNVRDDLNYPPSHKIPIIRTHSEASALPRTQRGLDSVS